MPCPIGRRITSAGDTSPSACLDYANRKVVSDFGINNIDRSSTAVAVRSSGVGGNDCGV